MKDFLKLLAFDVVLWTMIIGGLYFHLPYLCNLAIFIVPTMGILAMLTGLRFATMATKPESEWTEQFTKATEKLRSRPKYFVRYTIISTALETLLIAATGYFITATVYLIGAIVFFIGREMITQTKQAEGT